LLIEISENNDVDLISNGIEKDYEDSLNFYQVLEINRKPKESFIKILEFIA
jgi:hypothetical protein